MGYLLNSGSGFLKDAVNVASDVKTYLINKGGYLYDTIRIGINDYGQRVLDDGGTVEASAEAAASYREITKDIYDQASLVLFPSGYKDNLLYSHKPVNGSGDFTYTRGTDTATRVGADGYIKKERANLLVQSNQFDTTWIVNTSVSEGEEGYDGTNDAWSLTRATGGSLMARQENVTLSGVSTYSIYAKINTNNGIGLAFNGLSTAARFDLRDATKTQAVTETGIISSSQEYVGNGFYRLSITADVSGSTQLRIYLTTADAITSDGNGGTHIIQDAQVEQGLVPTSYIETTTAPVYEGLTDNLPRIDYTGGTPSILLEPSRINLIEYSEYFDAWTAQAGITLTANTTETLSPEGLNNAYKVVSTDATKGFYLTNVSVTQPAIRTIYLKGASGGETVSLKDGSGHGGSTSVTLTTEWVRYEHKTINDGNTYQGLFIDDISVGTIYAYGAQLEEGSYPTSYIPTYNASATRALDYSIVESLGYSSTCTFYYEFNATTGREGSSPFAEVGKDTSNKFYIKGSSENNPQFQVQGNGIFTGNISPTNEVLGINKIAVQWSSGVGVVFSNGVKQIGTLTNSNTSENIDFITMKGNGTFHDSKQLLFFEQALSDDDCEALTAL